MAVVRPLDELDLRDELRLDPDHVALLYAGHLRDGLERRRVALERPQLLEESLNLLVVEPGADVPDVDEVAALVGRKHERAEGPLTSSHAPGVAGDHELLSPVPLDLEPVA